MPTGGTGMHDEFSNQVSISLDAGAERTSSVNGSGVDLRDLDPEVEIMAHCGLVSAGGFSVLSFVS